MVYKTKRTEVLDFINSSIIPAVKKREADYSKVLNVIINETKVAPYLAEECLRFAINENRLKEVRVLTIPDEEVQNWLNDVIENEKKIKEEVKEVIDDNSNNE